MVAEAITIKTTQIKQQSVLFCLRIDNAGISFRRFSWIYLFIYLPGLTIALISQRFSSFPFDHNQNTSFEMNDAIFVPQISSFVKPMRL